MGHSKEKHPSGIEDKKLISFDKNKLQSVQVCIVTRFPLAFKCSVSARVWRDVCEDFAMNLYFAWIRYACWKSFRAMWKIRSSRREIRRVSRTNVICAFAEVVNGINVYNCKKRETPTRGRGLEWKNGDWDRLKRRKTMIGFGWFQLGTRDNQRRRALQNWSIKDYTLSLSKRRSVVWRKGHGAIAEVK